MEISTRKSVEILGLVTSLSMVLNNLIAKKVKSEERKMLTRLTLWSTRRQQQQQNTRIELVDLLPQFRVIKTFSVSFHMILKQLLPEFGFITTGLMKMTLMRSLLHKISAFSGFASSGELMSELDTGYALKIDGALKLLIPVLEAIVISDVASEKLVITGLEEIGLLITELRQLLETWHPLRSKIHYLERLTLQILTSTMEIFKLLESFELLPPELSPSSLEHCIKKIKLMGHDETSPIIRKMLDKQVTMGNGSDSHAEIAKTLKLTSNQLLLIEAVALDKLKTESENNGQKVEYIDQMIALVAEMVNELTLKQQRSLVHIPAILCCPLSLELMTDPVIVASGQTYERACIKDWIDLGLNICPKTRQSLAHTNLTQNCTVKDLIAYWCESNNVKLPEATRSAASLQETSASVSPFLSSSKEEVVHVVSGRQSATHNHNRTASESGTVEESNSAQDIPAQFKTRSQSHSIQRRLSERLVPQMGTSPAALADNRPSIMSWIEAKVLKLVEDLKSGSVENKRRATSEVRQLSKDSTENRIVVANCTGIISLLIELLHSTDSKIQEDAVTALLNLSINDNNRNAIFNADVISSLIHVLQTGNAEAKANSAATLFSLSLAKENRIRIGRSGAVVHLVELLGKGNPRGKKDAVTALFNISLYHENKARIVKAGAVRYLVELMDPAAGMVDSAVAVLANLSTITEGRTAIGHEIRGIPLLVEVVELGSPRGKETAAAALLQLCTNSNRISKLVVKEGVFPPLVALSVSGTPRAREKAQALLSHLRYQQAGRG